MQPYGAPVAPAPPAPPAPPQSSGGGGCGKAALGCAVGCGVLALLLLVAGGIGAWWLIAPGKQHPTSAVVSPAAEGSFAVGDLGADPGVTALLDHFVREVQLQQQQGMPPWMRQFQQMGAAGGSSSVGFRMMLPRQATFTLEEPAYEGDEPALLVALNPRGMTRMLRTLLPDEAVHGEHSGQRVLRFSPEGWGALVDGTFLFANREGALHAGIDRLLAAAEAPAAPPPDLGAPVREWDLTGTVGNRHGTLARLLLGEGGELPGAERGLLGIDLADRDLLAGRVVVECDGPAATEVALARLQARAAERAEVLAQRGLELRTAMRTGPRGAVVDWEVHGLAAMVSNWARNARATSDDSYSTYSSEE